MELASCLLFDTLNCEVACRFKKKVVHPYSIILFVSNPVLYYKLLVNCSFACLSRPLIHSLNCCSKELYITPILEKLQEYKKLVAT
jgi:hypothetical protein